MALSRKKRIVLVFGGRKQEIMFHEKILQQVPFFADALQKVKPESVDIRLEYLNHSKMAGDWLAQWLYFEQLPYDESDVAGMNEGDRAMATNRYVTAYMLAIQLKMEEWANRLADAFMYIPETEPYSTYYAIIRYDPGDTTKLESLVLTLMARSIRSMGWDLYTSRFDKCLVKRIKDDADLAVRLAEHLAKDDGTSMADLKKKDKCLFHIHEKTEKC
ncbi:hypothetical protein H2200_005791 [Cladophialophora chaetospira]|uniref:Uncharacterized protein n=1 Tax=Cladophialophora chaetospira TaxID=386627 RepID=A0AA39CIH8_9EURO|nr:hypothetical protein H2200_005791 [Cladophialophora chaetospira]